jgi:hypothetical protein
MCVRVFGVKGQVVYVNNGGVAIELYRNCNDSINY